MATEDQTPDPVDEDQDDQHEQDAGTDDGAGGPAREAQAQRARRREAEAARDAATAERDALVSRLERLQRADAERLAGEVLADGSDLWLVGGVQLADLLDAEGDLDATAVATAARGIVEQRGPRFGRPRVNMDGGVRQPPVPPAPSLGSVLQDQARGQRAAGSW